MTKAVVLMRHTDNDGDALTPEGVRAALEIGRRLTGRFEFMASSGAQRATQTAGCLLAVLAEEVPSGVIVEPGLRSAREDAWRAAYRSAGAGDLRSLEGADADLVREDSAELAAGLQRIFARLADGERALAIGHSPTLEAGILGLTGEYVDPLAKGGRIVVLEHDEEFTVERVR